jgi:hypothetical protein
MGFTDDPNIKLATKENNMCILSFKKNLQKQNTLFDEFFSEFNQIDIISFNYNGQGDALCECDGKLSAIDPHRLEKILFGVHKLSLENYLKSIFDPNSHSDEIHRTGAELIFRSPELSKLKKYDLANLAKKTLKEVQDEDGEIIVYFEQQNLADCHSATQSYSQDAQLFGNINSNTLHKSTCKSYNPSTCTATFSDLKEAEEAGYKPCGQCKPQ